MMKRAAELQGNRWALRLVQESGLPYRAELAAALEAYYELLDALEALDAAIPPRHRHTIMLEVIAAMSAGVGTVYGRGVTPERAADIMALKVRGAIGAVEEHDAARRSLRRRRSRISTG